MYDSSLKPLSQSAGGNLVGDSDREIALFLSAGVSTVVGLPTVCNFFGHVRFPEGKWYEPACERLNEQIQLAEGPNVKDKLVDSNAEKLFAKLAEMVNGVPQRIIPLSGGFSRWGGGADELLNFLKRDLVRIYGETTAASAKLQHHVELLKLANDLQPEGKPLIVFTTNYDRLVELVLSAPAAGQAFAPLHPRLRIGFNDESPGRWNPAEFRISPEAGDRDIHLIKLHGSVTWKWQQFGGAREPVETGRSEAAGELDCVLHFGYKGIPDSDPFKTLHEKLEDWLWAPGPRVLIAIGFRFADATIQNAIACAVRNKLQFHVVLALREIPDPSTELRKLMDQYLQRFSLLRGQDGELIPFGTNGFTDALRAVVDAARGRPYS
jgi:hypothetical protein